MAVGLRNIIIRFAGDTKGLEKAGKDGESSLSKWQSGFKKLDRVATGILVGLGGLIVGTVAKMASTADELDKTSQKMGVGVEALQELRFWADQNGLSHSNLERAMGRLNQRIGVAEGETNKYTEAIEALGVKLRGADGQLRDTEDVFRDTISALQEIEDPALQSAAAAEIFGTKMGRDLMPVLGDASLGIEEATERARELGIVMDEDAVAAGVEFGDALNELKLVGASLLRDFALPFLKVFQDSILPVIQERLIPAIRSMGDWIQRNQGVVVGIVGALLAFAAIIKTVGLAIKVFQGIMMLYRAIMLVATAVQWAWNVAVMANPIGLIVLAILALIAIIIALIVYWDDIKRAFEVAWNWIWERLKAFGKWIKETFWEKGLKRYFDLWIAIIQRVRDIIKGAFDRVRGFISNLLDRFREIPGKISGFFSKVKEFITRPFREAFNSVARVWNNTVGGFSWTAPGILGGFTISAPRMPTFHRGGIVPGPFGADVPILAQAGEAVLTPEQQAAMGGGSFEGNLFLDSGEFLGVVRGEIRRSNQGLKRNAMAGSGAAR